jgi:hypothetical protein
VNQNSDVPGTTQPGEGLVAQASRFGEAMMLDAKSNEAIREEIGERLRGLLTRQQTPVPPRLTELMRRLRELDEEESPSIVPEVLPGSAETWLQRWRIFRR